jgi:hypothetical protein
MIEEKIKAMSLRARMLLGQVSPVVWKVLREVAPTLDVAADAARALEHGQTQQAILHLSEELGFLALSELLLAQMAALRALGGVAEPHSYEAVRPIIRDMEDLLPLAEALEGGALLVRAGETDAPLPAA